MLYTIQEEIGNAVSHGIGVIFAVVATILLTLKGVSIGNPAAVVAFLIYGVGNILMFLSSTLYHSIPYPKAKRMLRVLDHCSIYLFIASCYTPILMLVMTGTVRLALMILIWSIALAGIVFKMRTVGKYDKFNLLSTVLYIAMGWVALFIIKPLWDQTGPVFVLLIAGGGLIYTIGTIFYKKKSIPYNHAIWHLFVLAANVVQFIAIYGFMKLQ